MTQWERLNAELTKKRKSWASLAAHLGLKKQNVGNWKSRGIPAKHLRGCAEFVSKTHDWLDIGDENTITAQSAEVTPDHKQKSTLAHTEQAQAAINNIANISERRSGGSVEAALRVLADAIRPLNANERDNIASQLRSFGRDPDSQMVLNGLLACLNSANASSQTEAPLQFYSSGGA